METLVILVGSAIGIGFVHTLLGIDHTLPFVVLGRARGWSLRRTLTITGLCGLGHVASSVVLGGVGIGLALWTTRFDRGGSHQWLQERVGAFGSLEVTRGNWSAWALIVFGLAYAAWSLAKQRRRQRHAHSHADGVVHAHPHGDHPHRVEHCHAPSGKSLTAWSLFVIFVLGPCEPLIPLVMVPAFALGIGATAVVTSVFAITTLATMMAVVAAACSGLGFARFEPLQVHAHAAAGLSIAAAGLAIRLFGI